MIEMTGEQRKAALLIQQAIRWRLAKEYHEKHPAVDDGWLELQKAEEDLAEAVKAVERIGTDPRKW